MQKNFSYKNASISYNVYSSGMPVVLLHGFAEDHTIWNNQLDVLQQTCMLIIPDLPGSGRSELLQGEDIQIDDYANCIHALLNHEKIESCIMIGHSMGGYITLAFAERYADKLRGFGLIHSTAFDDNNEKKQTRSKGIKMMEEYGGFAFVKNTTPNLFSESFKKEKPEIVEAVIESAKDFTTIALTQYYNAMLNRPNRKNVIEVSAVPVLFVAGTEDIAVPLGDVLQQAHLPRVSYIHVLNNVGHMSMLEAPGELNKHLADFLDLCEPD